MAIAVVGGGPAGLMAAEVLARGGASVTVFEKMPTVGRKLQVAGRGGLNLTHSEPLDAFLDRYGTARPWLTPAIEQLDPATLRQWCEDLDEPTFIGTSGRVFPSRLRATSLLRAWLRRLGDLGVELRTQHEWRGWDDAGRLLFTDADGTAVTVESEATVLALGGASWPRTGSDGAWVPVLEAADVTVTALRAANCGFVVDWSAEVRTRHAGTPIKDVGLHHEGVRSRGDLVVTRTGLEGGPIYALGAALRSTVDAQGFAVVELDLFPDATDAEVVERLARRRPKDSVTNGLRRVGLAPVEIAVLRDVTGNHPPVGPDPLAALLKALPVRLEGPQPITRAISTAGGVARDAVDERWMLTQRPGTFVAGEMLDWEAPTGGYLLQGAFSTGAAAARGALAWLAELPAERPA